jgi:hypothetical protein
MSRGPLADPWSECTMATKPARKALFSLVTTASLLIAAAAVVELLDRVGSVDTLRVEDRSR